MAMFPMTLGDPYPPTTIIFAFFVAFHIFVLGERRDFKFGTQVDRSYREQTVLDRGVVMSRDPFLPHNAMLAQYMLS